MQGNGESGGVSAQPPIIIKKVSAHGGGHGGAWKVAFADFVTAMMALFMVLWLMNANQEEKEAVSAYFNDPKGYEDSIGSGQAGSGAGMSVGTDDMDNLADKIQQAMKGLPQFEAMKNQIAMTVTGEGLRIELLETEKGMFFESGSPAPSGSGQEMLALISRELSKLPNTIIIEGHTDSHPFRGRADYSNWELSTDRGNSARRILMQSGIPEDRIVQVRGFANRQLRKPDAPDDPSNRRISLIVEYLDKPKGPQPAPSDGEHGAPAEHGAAAGPDESSAHGATAAETGSVGHDKSPGGGSSGGGASAVEGASAGHSAAEPAAPKAAH
jgi:chemotaxis protein MotB